MSTDVSWAGRTPNPKYPACAQVARHMLAEACGLKPGDGYPAEGELLRRATLIAAGENSREADLARAALAMIGEIGGL